VGFEVFDLLNQTAEKLHDKVVPQKESDTALAQVFAAADNVVDKVDKFRELYADLQMVDRVLVGAECANLLRMCPENNGNDDQIRDLFFVESANKKYKVELLEYGDLKLTNVTQGNEDAPIVGDLSKVRSILLNPVLENLSVGERYDIARFKKSADAFKIGE
jgi:hypothetical protein